MKIKKQSQTDYQNIRRFYDDVYYKGALAETAVSSHLRRLASKIKIHKGQYLLDIACGTGVLANELTRNGFSVAGLDVSEEMINVARSSFPNITFHVNDMRLMNLGIQVDLITCTFDSLNYLTSMDEMKTVFSNVNMHLVDSGYFLFDINTQKLYEDKQHGTVHHTIDGYEFDQILHYDKANQISRTVFLFDDGQYEEHIQKPYSYNDIAGMMAGDFKILRAFTNSALQEYELTSHKIFFLVQKSSGVKK